MSQKTEKKKKNSMATMKRANIVFLFVMLTIPVIHWFMFWLGVNFQSIKMAFQLPTGQWSTLNFKVLYKNITNENSAILLAVKNSLMWFALQNFVVFPFSIFLNYLFYKKMPGYKGFRMALIIPTLLSGVAISSMVSKMVLPSGPLGLILKRLGMTDVPLFFSDSRYANKAMVIYTLWLSWNSNMLLLGGTYARIPTEVLEAAKLDGCGPFRELIQLILPMISNTLSTMFILSCTTIFTASGPLILFTNGEYDTLTLSYWIFDSVRYGGASTYNTVSATGLVFTCLAIPIIMFIRWLLEKIPTVEY